MTIRCAKEGGDEPDAQEEEKVKVGQRESVLDPLVCLTGIGTIFNQA